jgi:hypothetical protein
MNFSVKSITLLLSIALVLSACTGKKEEESTTKTPTFATPAEAAQKAKADFIAALEAHKELNLGVDAARLREAQSAKLIKHVQVDFGKLLATDSVRSLADVAAAEKGVIAPFVAGNRVVAVAEIGKVSEGWRVSGLANRAITDDLNASGIVQRREGTATAYEIPNLNVMIYGVRQDTSETYFLNFDKFTLRDSTSASAFYPQLREHARRFNKEFGDRLKKEKLVK